MSARRVMLLAVACLVIVGSAYLWRMTHATGAPPMPGTSVALDQSVRGFGMKTTDQLLAFWAVRFGEDPRDYISLTQLGQSYISKARETGDVGSYDRAEAALRRGLDLNPDYEPALAYLSTVLFNKHDFETARDLARRVYSADPQALQALATFSDAELELGNYTAAADGYNELAQRAPGPAVDGRLARLDWLHGRTESAIVHLQQAHRDAVASGFTGESVAWYQLQLADLYFNTGRLEEAASHYSAAMDLFADYYLALAGLGRVRAAQGRYPEAIALYEQAVAIVPQPTMLAALGDLYKKTGDVALAQLQYDTVEVIAKLAAVNQAIYNRELSLFYSDHDLKPDEALSLAEKELAVRKDVYGYDTMAWALYKNDRPADAAEAMTMALKLGTKDPKLFYHAGVIYHALGEKGAAQTYLEEAVSLNPHFFLLYEENALGLLSELRGAEMPPLNGESAP